MASSSGSNHIHQEDEVERRSDEEGNIPSTSRASSSSSSNVLANGSSSSSGGQQEQPISPEQTDILLQFQDLTRIEDLGRCQTILSSHSWNLEAAARSHTFGDEEDEGPSSSDRGSQSEQESPLRGLRQRRPQPVGPAAASQATPPVVAANSEPSNNSNNNNQISIFTGVFRILSLPFTFFYDSLLSVLQFAWNLVRPDPRRNLVDPLGDVISFIAQFEEKYGDSHPTFFSGTYSQALAEAKRDLKFLLVYLHNENHQDTDDFCREVLIHSEVTGYITRNNIVFWACSVNKAEGYRVSTALRENTYPFLGLIALRDNRMLLVRRFEGSTTVERLLSQVQQGINDNEASFVAARADRAALRMNQDIRTEQDAAYQESLKADQEKERKKKVEQDRKNAEEKVKSDAEQLRLDKRDQLLRMKIELADRIPAEPEASAPNVIRLVAKLPNGTRLERRFLRSASIKYLVYFVFCHEQSPLAFTVKTNFPCIELPCKTPTLENPDCTIIDDATGRAKAPISFAEFGLGSSEMVFVSDLDA